MESAIEAAGLLIEECVAPASSSSLSEPVVPKQRTKIVFYDSDDEEATVSKGEATVVVQVQSEYNFTHNQDDLVDEILLVDQDAVDQFFEDITPVATVTTKYQAGNSSLDAGAPKLLAAAGLPQRVIDITPDPQLHHPFDATSSKRPLRPAKKPISISDAVSSKKRFREESDIEDVGEDTETPLVIAAPLLSTNGPVAENDDVVVGENELEGQQESGSTETLLKVIDGYRLTLDEADIQDEFFEEDGEVLGEDEAADEGDDFGDMDDEEEEDEEMDNLVVVAAVEQLVRCCEEEMATEGGTQYVRFIEKAKEHLKLVETQEMTTAEFADKMNNDVYYLEKTFRRVNRPKDAPIVINGVVMDM